ncbi:MAG: iron-sulfur cluster assembly protein, partial [Pseudomonadota bacterium]
MSNEIKKKIIETLETIHLPDAGTDIVTTGMVEDIHIEDGHAMITLKVDPAQGTALENLRQQVEMAARQLPEIDKVTAVLTAERPAKTTDQDMQARVPERLGDAFGNAVGAG